MYVCWPVERAKYKYHCSKNKFMFVLNFLVSPEAVKCFFVNVVYLLLKARSDIFSITKYSIPRS